VLEGEAEKHPPASPLQRTHYPGNGGDGILLILVRTRSSPNALHSGFEYSFFISPPCHTNSQGQTAIFIPPNPVRPISLVDVSY
jgi:hypothetical protein